jgi:hypothetical protein
MRAGCLRSIPTSICHEKQIAKVHVSAPTRNPKVIRYVGSDVGYNKSKIYKLLILIDFLRSNGAA